MPKGKDYSVYAMKDSHLVTHKWHKKSEPINILMRSVSSLDGWIQSGAIKVIRSLPEMIGSGQTQFSLAEFWVAYKEMHVYKSTTPPHIGHKTSIKLKHLFEYIDAFVEKVYAIGGEDNFDEGEIIKAFSDPNYQITQ